LHSEKIALTCAKELATLVAVVVLGEFLLRAIAPDFGHKIFDNKFTGSYEIGLNADKYRGHAYPIEKSENGLRILALGDSETFGTGVAADQTWPAQLESVIRKKGTNCEVLNGALEGMSPSDISQALQDKWKAYRPDVVVFGLTAWMVSLAATSQTPKSYESLAARYGDPPTTMARLQVEAGRLFHSIYTVGFISNATQFGLYWAGLLDHRLKKDFPYGSVVAYGWQQGDIPANHNEIAWSGFEREFVRLSKLAQSRNAKVVLVWLPPRFDMSHDLRDNQKNVPRERFSMDPVSRANRVADAAGATFVNALGRLKSVRKELATNGKPDALYIHFDVGHFDADGNRAVAEAIAENFEDLK
jgi:lysophospholipase L1-like esterase